MTGDENVKLDVFFDKFIETLKRSLNKIANETTLSAAQKTLKNELKKVTLDEDGLEGKAYISANTIIFTLILLFRQGYLKEVSPNVRDFIGYFLHILSPLVNEKFIEKFIKDSESDDKMLYEKFLEHLQSIPSGTWDSIVKNTKPEINFRFWGELISIASVKKVCDSEEFKKTHCIIIDECPGNYQYYFNALHRKLQERFSYSDIILIDTIHLGEFKEKGVFDSIEDYLEEDDKKMLKIEKEQAIKLGQTLNGKLDAIPLTRNFHLPAYDNAFLFKEQILEQDGQFPKHIRSLVSLDQSKKDGDKSIVDSFRNKFEHDPERLKYFSAPSNDIFVTFMGNDSPFVPLQAAIGPHVVYSSFAYLLSGRDSDKDDPLIHVGKNKEETEINLWNQSKLSVPAIDMLKCVYTYVPAISLCAEHNISNGLRDWRRGYWFDPCLPIEADRFGERSDFLVFADTPLLGGNSRQPMSCLGGYCLALNKKSNAKDKAVKSIVQITKDYFKQACETAVIRREINYLVKYDYLITEDQKATFNKAYRDITGLSLGKRPIFHGWKMLEDSMSNVMRLYIATTIIYRAIVAETNGTGMDPEQIYIKDALKEEMITNYFKVIKQQSLQWMKTNHPNTVFKIFNNPEEWLDANFAPLNADRITIKGLLQAATEQAGSGKNRHEQVLKFLAERLAENLVEKLKSICIASGWKVSKRVNL